MKKTKNGNLKVDNNGNYIINEGNREEYVKQLNKPVSSSLLDSSLDLNLRKEEAKQQRSTVTKKQYGIANRFRDFIGTEAGYDKEDLAPLLRKHGDEIRVAIEKRRYKNA